MTTDTSLTFERLKDGFVNLFNIDAGLITPEADWDALGLDSLDYFKITCLVEDEFQIQIDDVRFAELKTFADIVAYVDAAISEKANA